jgi:UV DNA damage endonuclease
VPVQGLRIGYACINTRLPSPARTLRLANATPDRLREIVAANLDALADVLRWNAENGIRVFRVTSNLVPFASHPVNTLAWWDEFGERFAELGTIVAREEMRLSMHPGQHTVLSSARAEVVEASIAELVYHDRVLDLLGLDSSHKVVVHVGSGARGSAAGDRFVQTVEVLPPGPRSRLVVENDERWPLEDVLALAREASLPVVLDVFHHELAPSFPELGVRDLVERAAPTWRRGDGRQEVHFSTQAAGRRPGAHAEALDLDAFALFAAEVGDLPLDCVLEVKDKERSALGARPVLESVGRGGAAT